MSETTVYNSSVYNNGGGGGGSNVDLDFSQPVFVQQMTTDDSDISYDARLDNILYKLPSGYKKVRGIRNTARGSDHPIHTGVSTDDGIDFEMIAGFFINSWVQYAQIIGNTYLSGPEHFFSISCGDLANRVNCFVNTNYTSYPSVNFQNGSTLCLRQTGGTRIAKDVYYPYTSYLATSTTGNSNTSEIVIFGGALVTVYHLYIKKGGVVVLDFIPCVRQSDNVPGFYDKVTNTFFTNDDPSILAAVYP